MFGYKYYTDIRQTFGSYLCFPYATVSHVTQYYPYGEISYVTQYLCNIYIIFVAKHSHQYLFKLRNRYEANIIPTFRMNVCYDDERGMIQMSIQYLCNIYVIFVAKHSHQYLFKLRNRYDANIIPTFSMITKQL